MLTAKETLDQAADLIEKEGWVQGMMHGFNGYCAYGAIMAINPEHFEVIITEFKNGVGIHENLTHWNDRPRRTKEQVIEKMRAFVAL